jgi:hypothetical protein
MIDEKKLSYIENYFFENEEHEFLYLVLHSLFNCISEEEVAQLYLYNSRGNPKLRKTLESYVVNRTIKEPKRQFNAIAINLLDAYGESDYRAQIAIRVFVSKFVRTLPKETIVRFYETLVSSERKLDRHQANSVADLIWSDEIAGELIGNFYKYKDEYSLLPLIQNLEPRSLGELAKKFWTKDFPRPWLKRSILMKISSLSMENFEFLRIDDPLFFTQILSLKKGGFSEKEIRTLLKSFIGNDKYYFIWNIGLSGNWEQITYCIEKIIK